MERKIKTKEEFLKAIEREKKRRQKEKAKQTRKENKNV